MKDFIVFYAWQSDTPQAFNRHFIRAALNFAAKNISNDKNAGITVSVDADTEGVLGHCPVTDIILNKITNCNAFVPDLTFVASTKDGKLIPNPNVMLEYGYALKSHSFSVMIPVMNVSYGLPQDLPFDMKHLRFPLAFNLPANATRKERSAARKVLTEQFEAIIRNMISQGSYLTDGKPFPRAEIKSSPAFFFPKNDVIASFGNPGEQEYKFDGDNAFYLRFYPKTMDGQQQVTRATINTIVNNDRKLLPMSRKNAGISCQNEYGWSCIDPSLDNTTKSISQIFSSGEFWGITSDVFKSVPSGNSSGRYTVIPIISVELIYLQTLDNFISIASNHLRLRPPFIIELGAVKIRDIYIAAPHPEFENGHYYGPIREDAIAKVYDLKSVDADEIEAILRNFFEEIYDLALIKRSDILTDEYVNQFRLPRRT